MAKTVAVLAEVPVLGMRRGARAELTDSPYLRQVIAQGWLTRTRKSDGDEPEPLSDAAVAGPTVLESEAAVAAEAAEAAAEATS